MLTNKDYVRSQLTREAAWKDSHNATDDYLGWGMLYYTLAYSLKARLCVCLGSGAGFVPRIMRQAQRDLELPDARTVLVDANLQEAGGEYPQWPNEDHFFRRAFSDVEIVQARTLDAAPSFKDIDYLHIDADHSYKAVKADFETYEPRMRAGGVITLHDTAVKRAGVRRLLAELRTDERFDVLHFPQCNAGIAAVMRIPNENE
jgi:predicted O-methyltransferase YrrM